MLRRKNKLVELFELCFTPAPLSDDGYPLSANVQIYRYATDGRNRKEGPITEVIPVEDRIGAEAFALRHNMVRDGAWRTTGAGYDSVTLTRLA